MAQQVSCSSQSAKLSNTSLYPSLFRTVPAFQGIQNVLHEFIIYYNWTQVFIFSQDINFNTQVTLSTLITISFLCIHVHIHVHVHVHSNEGVVYLYECMLCAIMDLSG